MFPYIPNKPHNFYLYSCTFHLSLQTNYYLYYFTPFSLHLPVTIFFITISLFCTIDFILHSPFKKKKKFYCIILHTFYPNFSYLTLFCNYLLILHVGNPFLRKGEGCNGWGGTTHVDSCLVQRTDSD